MPHQRKRSLSVASSDSGTTDTSNKRPRSSSSSSAAPPQVPLHFLTLDRSPVYIPPYPSFADRLTGTSTWDGARGEQKQQQEGRAPHLDDEQDADDGTNSRTSVSPLATTATGTSRRSSLASTSTSASTARTSLSLLLTHKAFPSSTPPLSSAALGLRPEVPSLSPAAEHFLPAFSPAFTAAGGEEKRGDEAEKRRKRSGREGEVRKAVMEVAPDVGSKTKRKKGEKRALDGGDGDHRVGESRAVRTVQVDLGEPQRMNDRQVDELLALEAIYPDTASWRLVSAETGAKDEQVVEVKVVLPVEFEEEVEVEVWDYVAPSPSSSSVSVAEREGKSCGGQDLAKRVEGLKVGEEKMPEKAVRAGTGGGGNGGKGRRRRTGGGAGNGGGKALAADAAPFQPSLPPAQPRNGQRSRAAPATVPAASESKRSPASARIAVPSPPLSASPLLASPPSLAAEGKTLRIRFAPRAPSPPPVPVAPTPSSSMGTTVAAPPQPVKLRLRYLPPLEMTISLGAGYPETEGPKEIKLREKEAEKEKEETVKWVGEERLREAEGRLKEAYLPGEESLFSIVDLLTSTSSTFLPTLSLSLPLVLRQVSPVPSSALLSSSIASFNSRSLSARFSATSHLCPLCFSPSRGSSCIRLSSCNCTFCTPCLKDYFSLLITEGLVRSVACPSRGCVEERAAWEKRTGGKGREEDVPGRVEGDEVERLCGKEGRERWEWLKEKVRVESDPTIAFCPIPSCQAACPKVEDEEKLRICPKCSYSFCLFCRSTWHGVRNQCALPQSSAIVTSYLAGDATEKASLEMRYGAANLKRLVAAYEEERLLREWLEENATRCPGCDIPIEKSHGCNHVTCAKCQTHLCYRCGKSISPTDPYKHFSTPGGRCYGHLFDFNPGHEPGVEEWIGEIIAEDEAGGVGH